MNKVAGAICGLALLLAGMMFGATGASAVPGPLDLGRAAPSLQGNDLSGKQQVLSDYQGKWVYIDFWATWCKPCLAKLPSVVQLQRETAGQADFAILSVSLDQSGAESEINKVREDFGVDFPVIYDGEGWMSGNVREWGVEAIPATFLVDPAGRLVARDVEPVQVQQIIQRAGQVTYQPITVRTSERLLADSPSTGSSAMQDLHIGVDMLPDSPRISHYRLEFYYAYRDEQNQLQAHSAGYQIDVEYTSADAELPYDIAITKTNSRFVDREWLNTPILAEPQPRPVDMPGVSAAIDTDMNNCEFTLAIPNGYVSTAYSLCFYDEALGEYVCNGIRMMMNPS